MKHKVFSLSVFACLILLVATWPLRPRRSPTTVASPSTSKACPARGQHPAVADRKVCELGHCARWGGPVLKPRIRAEATQGGDGIDPNVEAIVALRPDVVLAAKSSRVAERLEALGIRWWCWSPNPMPMCSVCCSNLAVLEVADAQRVWRAIDAGLPRRAIHSARTAGGQGVLRSQPRGHTRRASHPYR